MNLEAILAIVVVEQGGEGMFVVAYRNEDGKLELPCLVVDEDKTSLDAAAFLLRNLTGLEAKLCGHGWIDLISLPVADEVGRYSRYQGRVVGIPYAAMVPHLALRSKQYLVPVLEAFASEFVGDHKEIFNHACRAF